MEKRKPPSWMTRYWGKTNKKTLEIHLLAFHLMDVGAVAWVAAREMPSLVPRFLWISGLDGRRLSPETARGILALSAALHDVGKFAVGFQQSHRDTLEKLGRTPRSQSNPEYHDHQAFRLWATPSHRPDLLRALGASGYDGTGLGHWLAALWGHHGTPPLSGRSAFDLRLQLPDRPDSDGVCARADFFAAVEWLRSHLVGPGLPRAFLGVEARRFAALSWWMAGFVTVCDWIGSSVEWFPLRAEPEDPAEYWNRAVGQAERAIRELDLASAPVFETTGLSRFWPEIGTPSSLPAVAERLEPARGPQIFWIEGTRSSGRTEAALALAHRWMKAGEGDGVYWASPSQEAAEATRDSMEERVRERFFSTDGKPLLLSGWGRSEISESPWLEWPFGDEKRFLGHFCWGTLDAALRAVLSVKHQAVRLWALAGKMLIIDEVPCGDSVAHTRLCRLLAFQAALGGSVLLLSGALPTARRAELFRAFCEGSGSEPPTSAEDPLPRPAHGSADGVYRTLSVDEAPESAAAVTVRLVREEDRLLDIADEAVSRGLRVCWVCDTAEGAQALAARCRALRRDPPILWHERFTVDDAKARQAQAESRFRREDHRSGCLLITTGAREPHFEGTCDVVISDLAPAELLAQRADRLDRAGDSEARLYLVSPTPDVADPKRFVDALGSVAETKFDPGRLWLTTRYFLDHSRWDPATQARELMEDVYGSDSDARIPDELREASRRLEREQVGQASRASLSLLELRDGYSRGNESWSSDVGGATEPVWLLKLVHSRRGTRKPVPWNDSWDQSRVPVARFQALGLDRYESVNARIGHWFPGKKPNVDDAVLLLREQDGGWVSAEGWTYSSEEGLRAPADCRSMGDGRSTGDDSPLDPV